MTARARVEHNFASGGVAIFLGWRTGNQVSIIEPATLTRRFVETSDTYIASEPSLCLDDDMARAVLDALAAYFGGTAEVQTLRGDYLAERARVDKMIDTLLMLSTVGRLTIDVSADDARADDV